MPRKLYPGPWIPTGCGSYRELRAGVCELTWRDHTGQRRRRLPMTPEEAAEFLQAKSKTQKRVRAGLQAATTWDNAVQLYRVHHQARKHTQTYVDKLFATLEQFRAFQSNELDTINSLQVEAFLDQCALANVDKHGRRRRGWAATTNLIRARLHSFFAYLVGKHLLPSNPVGPVSLYPETKQPPRDLTPAEYAALWHVAAPGLRDVMDFILLTGCRISEAAALRFADIQPDGRWVAVNRKGKDYLKQILEPDVLAIVFRQARRPDQLVFHRWPPYDTAKPLADCWLNNRLETACRAAQIPPVTAHDFRHAAGSWCGEEGFNETQIQRLLGHATPTTTRRYIHGDGSTVAKVLQKKLVEVRATAIKGLDDNDLQQSNA